MNELRENKLPRKLLLLAVICCAAYVVYAMYFNVIGSNSTTMMAFYNITEGQQGFIITMQSIGALAATFFLALFGERFNKIHATALGIGLMALASILIGLTPQFAGDNGYGMLLALVVLAGFGYIFIDIMVNSAVADNYQNKGTVLPIVHAFHGIGMIIAPLMVAAVVTTGDPSTVSRPFVIIGVLAAAVFVVYLICGKRITPETAYKDMTEIRKRSAANPAEIFRAKESWILLLAATTYFAFQLGTSNWMVTFGTRSLQMEGEGAEYMLTLFFVGALVMRFVTPMLLKRIKTKNLYILFGVLSCACMAILMAVQDRTAAFVLVTLSGFFQGAHATLLVLMGSSLFPHRTASASSIVSFAIAISGVIFPLAMGVLAESAGIVASFTLIIVTFACSCLVIFLLGRKKQLD